MFQKIVVPLDGSKLAECVLGHATELAKGCGTEEIILVSVTERIVGKTPLVQSARSLEPLVVHDSAQPTLQPLTDFPVTIGKKQRQAQRYLDRIARRLAKRRVKIETAVLLGHPAEEIVRYAQKNDCGLIAMASHGRSGISRWAYGSVADKILRSSPIPVLIVKAPGSVPGS